MNSRWRFAVLVAALWLPPSAPVASAQTTVSTVHVVTGPSQLPLWIAHEQGLFAKQGIDLVLLRDAGSSRRITGEIPFGVLGMPAVIAAVAEGRDLRVLVALDSPRASAHLMAKPDIKTPDDLRGKRIGVTRIGLGFWILALLGLEHLGIDPKRDRIGFIEVGGDASSLAQALEAGAIDAALLDPAQSAQLRAKAFSMLLDMYPADISGIQNVLAVAGPYLREHPDVVERMVAGLAEGIAFSRSPRNRETVVKTLMAHLGVSAPEAAEQGYRTFLARANRKPYASVVATRNMRRVMALHDPRVLNVKVEDLVDDRFVRKLDESGTIDRLYATYGVQ
jgi:ABC-type nitrate/sulfonate/bicarbonate transport system substrate-binding protein